MNKYSKLLCAGCVAAFLILIIPLLYISKYNVMGADDFGYGCLGHLNWISNRNLLGVLSKAYTSAYDHYFSWQGSFVAIFLMALVPSVFGEAYYFTTTFITIGSLILSTLFFCYVIIRKAGKGTICDWLTLSAVWLLIDTQFLPSAVQAFYWYNGSIYYTFFYSLALLLYALAVLYTFCGTKKKILMPTAMSFLAAAIGGGNLVTALQGLLVVTLIIVICIYNGNKRYKVLFLPLIFLAVTFIINVIAPGNAVRQTYFQSPGAIKSILLSIKWAFIELIKLSSTPVPAFILITSPILYNFAGRLRWSFKYPLAAIGLAFLLYAAQYCPHLYAAYSPGPGRLLNIIFYSSAIFYSFCLVYIFGWLQNRVNQQTLDKITCAVKKHRLSLTFTLLTLAAAAYLLSPFSKTFSSWYAITALRDGSAKQYYAEYMERLEILNNPEIKDAELKEYTVKPYLLFFDDGQEDPTAWQNKTMSKWYSKSSITVKPNDTTK